MGTPHQGHRGVDLQKLALRVAKVIEGTDTGISKHLNRDPGWLRQLEGQYEPINNEFVITFAYETVPTLGKMIVRYCLTYDAAYLIYTSRWYRSLRQYCQAFLMRKQLQYLQIILT
jgi:hypothetical protein